MSISSTNKLQNPNRALNILNECMLVAFALLCTYPLYYVFINSLSSYSEIIKGVYFYPRALTLDNYQQIMKTPLIFTGVFISAMRTVVGTVLSLLCSGLLGYLVTKRELPCRRGIYRLIVITMYFNAGLIPWYMLMKALYLKNTFFLYVLPTAVSGFYVILIKTYIESIPQSLEESAAIDGAGILTIFFRIIVPVALPVLACIAVFSAVGQWNSWADNMFLVSDKNLQTLQYLLYRMLTGNSDAITGRITIQPMSLRLTMTFVTVFPILLVYPFMQRYFIKGIMLGAIKG